MKSEHKYFQLYQSGGEGSIFETFFCLRQESKLKIQVQNKKKVTAAKRNRICECPRV